jgi:hypothetical protein
MSDNFDTNWNNDDEIKAVNCSKELDFGMDERTRA